MLLAFSSKCVMILNDSRTYQSIQSKDYVYVTMEGKQWQREIIMKY